MRSWIVMGNLLAMTATTLGGTFTTYSVGNSLTEDMYGSLSPLVGSRGRDYASGFHMRPSSSLTYINDHPNDYGYAVAPYGPFAQALPNYPWDAVTFQPYYQNPGIPSTLATDTAAISSLINLTQQNASNASTHFLSEAGGLPTINMQYLSSHVIPQPPS